MPLLPEDELNVTPASPLHPGPALLRNAFVVHGRRILGVVTSFLIGQGAAQALGVLAGLFLVRHLSIEAFAQLGLALGFQTMFSTLMDLGFAGTIIPMVGAKKDDRALVGRYVRSAKHLRDLSFFALAPVAVIVSLAIMHRRHWPLSLQISLLVSTLVALYCGGKASYFSSALILHGKLRSYYVLQVVSNAIRLLSYVALFFAGILGAGVAAAIGAFTILLTAEWYGRHAKRLMDWPAREDAATDKEIVRYILPAAPAMLFTAFQAQLTLFLISIFGGQTAYIAQVAALGRIGQLFTVLTTFNLMVIEPFIARRNHKRLLPTFVALTALASVALAPLVYAAFRWPQVFLLLIGPKYANLTGLLGWVILAATINYIAGLIWMMNRARKWVFWSGSFVEVGLLVVVQVAFLMLFGIRNTRDAVMLTFAASICVLIAHSYVSVLGFWKLHRERQLSPAVVS